MQGAIDLAVKKILSELNSGSEFATIEVVDYFAIYSKHKAVKLAIRFSNEDTQVNMNLSYNAIFDIADTMGYIVAKQIAFDIIKETKIYKKWLMQNKYENEIAEDPAKFFELN